VAAIGSWDARRPSRSKAAPGYDYLHVAVDDCSRVAFVQLCPDESGPTAARFLLQAAHFSPFRASTSSAFSPIGPSPIPSPAIFKVAIARLAARHLVTRPYRRQTDGKAERFIRTLLQEWAYARFYRTNAVRQQRLSSWLHFYNPADPIPHSVERLPTQCL
jgi:transposase InsO family protein